MFHHEITRAGLTGFYPTRRIVGGPYIRWRPLETPDKKNNAPAMPKACHSTEK